MSNEGVWFPGQLLNYAVLVSCKRFPWGLGLQVWDKSGINVTKMEEYTKVVLWKQHRELISKLMESINSWKSLSAIIMSGSQSLRSNVLCALEQFSLYHFNPICAEAGRAFSYQPDWRRVILIPPLIFVCKLWANYRILHLELLVYS